MNILVLFSLTIVVPVYSLKCYQQTQTIQISTNETLNSGIPATHQTCDNNQDTCMTTYHRTEEDGVDIVSGCHYRVVCENGCHDHPLYEFVKECCCNSHLCNAADMALTKDLVLNSAGLFSSVHPTRKSSRNEEEEEEIESNRANRVQENY